MLESLALLLLLAAPAPAAGNPKKQVDMSGGAPTSASDWPKVEAALAKAPGPASAADMLDGIESPFIEYPGPPEPERYSNPVAIVLDATGMSQPARTMENLPANAAADLGHWEHVSNSAPGDPYYELRVGERQRSVLYGLVRRVLKNNRGDDARAMDELRHRLREFARKDLQGRAHSDCSRIRERAESRLEAVHFGAALRRLGAQPAPVLEKGQAIYRAAGDAARESRYPADYRAYFSAVRDAARAVAPNR